MEYQGNTDYDDDDDDDDDDAGEHTDYNEGFVLPMALPLVTLVVGRSHYHHCHRIGCHHDHHHHHNHLGQIQRHHQEN